MQNQINTAAAILVHTTDLAAILGTSAAVAENLATYQHARKEGGEAEASALLDLADIVAHLTASAARLAESALKGGE